MRRARSLRGGSAPSSISLAALGRNAQPAMLFSQRIQQEKRFCNGCDKQERG